MRLPTRATARKPRSVPILPSSHHQATGGPRKSTNQDRDVVITLSMIHRVGRTPPTTGDETMSDATATYEIQYSDETETWLVLDADGDECDWATSRAEADRIAAELTREARI